MAIGDITDSGDCEELYMPYLAIESGCGDRDGPDIFIRTTMVYDHQPGATQAVRHARIARARRMADAIAAFVRQHHGEWDAAPEEVPIYESKIQCSSGTVVITSATLTEFSGGPDEPPERTVWWMGPPPPRRDDIR